MQSCCLEVVHLHVGCYRYYRDEQQELGPAEDFSARRQDPEELLREAEEQAQAAEVQLLDEKSLRKMLNQFEKKAKENLELRMKYAEDPMKFLDNEVDLMSIIRGLAQVAADPNTLYPMLIDSPAVATLSGLLSHDNTDIAIEVLDLLQEITDADEEEDNQEVAGALVDALQEANALELLVERLTKLNESVDEEANAVNHALAFIEHALELRPALAGVLLERTKLLKWLLSRIRIKASDSNKQYASEILSILMQGNESNQALLGGANGIDTLLVCLAGFKSKEPADAEEQEFMENVFDTLCSCLMLPANRSAFVECEGMELMHLLLKSKKSSRYGAIKAIDFATTRCPPACDRLVEAGALAQLFAVFMGRSKVKNSKGEADKEAAREVEERCISIISNLFQGVTKNSRKERLAAKFVEAEFEKVDRLMEIAFRYEAGVRASESRLAAEAAELGEDVDEDELLLERLDAGLFTLQCVMVILAALWSTGDPGLRKRLLAGLHQRGHSLEVVRGYLREYYFGLGDDGAPEEKQRQLQRLGQLLSVLGAGAAEVDDVDMEGRPERSDRPERRRGDDKEQEKGRVRDRDRDREKDRDHRDKDEHRDRDRNRDRDRDREKDRDRDRHRDKDRHDRESSRRESDRDRRDRDKDPDSRRSSKRRSRSRSRDRVEGGHKSSSSRIRRFEFRGIWKNTPAMVVIHLRTVCIGQVLTVRGVMGIISLTPAVDKENQYTVPKPLVDFSWQVYEQPQRQLSCYWMLPRHQLVVLAGWGRAMRLAFLDITEYLVLPGAAAAAGSASSDANQGLQASNCFRLVQSQSQLQQQLLQESSAFLQFGPQPPAKYRVHDSEAVLRVARFDTLLSLPCSGGSALPLQSLDNRCSQAQNRWYNVANQGVQISQCPVEEGGPRASRKPVVSPHLVVVVRHYTAAAKGTNLNGPTMPTACGYLLHILNLMPPSKGQQQQQRLKVPIQGNWMTSAGGQYAALPGHLELVGGVELPQRKSGKRCKSVKAGVDGQQVVGDQLQ
eukprot:gene10490-10649_t